MALIKCTHCGKEISDTVEICIHCGKRIRDEGTEKRQLKDFNSLSFKEQTDLKKEFCAEFPKYEMYENKNYKVKKIHKITTICAVIGGIMFLSGIPSVVFNGNEILNFIGFVGLLLCCACGALFFLFPFLQCHYKKKHLVSLKKYQQWLKDVKGIKYTVFFNTTEQHWKDYFDEINLTEE